jgi:ribonuclease E
MHQPEPAIAEPTSASASESAAEDDDKPAPRRSTVREKVSFGSASAPAAETPAMVAPHTPSPESAAAPETSADPAPRKAGWWSRRFGGGE